MLEMLERYAHRIRGASSDSDVAGILADVATDLGFRSGFMILFDANRHAISGVDSDPTRGAWWRGYFERLKRIDPAATDRWLAEPLHHMDARRFEGRAAELRIFAEKNDMVDVVFMPLTHGGTLVAAVGFSGRGPLTQAQESALRIIAYTLYMQASSFRGGLGRSSVRRLTTREREVMGVLAEGLTSEQAAARLGMSPRTVNQHVDNVAEKLGTKNRTHTVAEAIRNNLLN